VKAGQIAYTEDFLSKSLVFIKKEDVAADALLFDPDSGLLGFVCVTDLREGMVVGEKGLYDGTPRSATVLCLEDCDFACLLKKDYDRLLRDANKELIEEVRDFFYQHVFKKSVQRGILASLGSDFSKKMILLRKDKFVFRQDSPDTNIYIIKRGTVMLQTFASRSADPLPLEELPPKNIPRHAMNLITKGDGEIFGEEVLFTQRRGREYSVKVCSDDCLLFTASYMTVRGHLLNNPALKDYFRDIFEKKQAVRLRQVETISSTMFTRDGLRRTDLTSLAAAPTGLVRARVRDPDSFNQKYKNELTEFKLKTPCCRNPLLQMKCDYEQTILACQTGNKEIDDLRSLSVRDYLHNDRDFELAAQCDRDYATHRRKLIRKKYTECNLPRTHLPLHLTNSSKTKATENPSRFNDSIEESIKAQSSHRRDKLARTGREEFSDDLKSPYSLRAGDRSSQAASAKETLSVSLSQGKSPRNPDRSCMYPRVAMRSSIDHKSSSPKRMTAPSIPSLTSNRSHQLQDTQHIFRSTHLVGELVRFKKFSGAIDLNKTYSLRK